MSMEHVIPVSLDRPGDAGPPAEADCDASVTVANRLRRFLAGNDTAACDGGLAASQALLRQAFADQPIDSDVTAGWMIDSAHLMYCWVLVCDTDRGAAKRLIDYVSVSAPDRMADAALRADPISRIALLRSTRPASSVDEAIFALSALTYGLGWDDAAVMMCLATAHLRRYQRDGRPVDLDTAIDLFRAMTRRLGDPSLTSIALRRLAESLDARHDIYSRPADVAEAASALLLVLPQASEQERPAVAQKLAATLLLTYQSTGDETALDDATALLDELVVTDPNPAIGHPWDNLASARALRYQLRGDADDLDAAIAAYREAAKTDDRDDVTLANLGIVLAKRFELARAPADLEESLRLLRSIVERTPENDAEYPLRLTSLGAALSLYATQFGSNDALEEMIAVLRRATDAATDPTERASALHDLGDALQDRYEWHGDPFDRDESIECFEQAAAGANDDPLARPMYLMSLGRALNLRFGAFGDEHDSARAVSALRGAIDQLPPGNPDRSVYLSAMAQALNDRFRHRRDPADVHEAIRYAQASVAATPLENVDRSIHLNDLGIALHYRYEVSGDPDDLDRAIRTFREAVDCSAGAVRSRPVPYTNLAGALQDKFRRTGELSTLDSAVAAFWSARRIAGPNDPNRTLYDSNIGEALSLRSRQTGRADDVDEAIAILTRAIEAIGSGNPRLTVLRSNLASALATKVAVAGRTVADNSRDVDDAMGQWQAAVEFTAAPAFERMRAALEWVQFTDDRDDVVYGAAARSAAVRLLPLLAWHGLDRRGQEWLLVGHRELARDAAARSFAAGQVAAAVELLEVGRSVLWTQRLESHSDFERLARYSDNLAFRLAAVRAQLDIPS